MKFDRVCRNVWRCTCPRCLVSRTDEEHLIQERPIQRRLFLGEYMNRPEDQTYRKSLGNAMRVIAEKAEHSNVVEAISAKRWVFNALADTKDKMKLREIRANQRRRKSDGVGFTPFQ